MGSSSPEQAATKKVAVFISYSWKDHAFATRLQADLTARGAEVWLDSIKISPGDRIADRITRGLQQTTHVLQLLSPYSVRSKWVERENEWARDQNKTICVVAIAKCKVPRWSESWLVAKVWGDEPTRRQGYRDVLGFLGLDADSPPLPELPEPSPPPWWWWLWMAWLRAWRPLAVMAAVGVLGVAAYLVYAAIVCGEGTLGLDGKCRRPPPPPCPRAVVEALEGLVAQRSDATHAGRLDIDVDSLGGLALVSSDPIAPGSLAAELHAQFLPNPPNVLCRATVDATVRDIETSDTGGEITDEGTTTGLGTTGNGTTDIGPNTTRGDDEDDDGRTTGPPPPDCETPCSRNQRILDQAVGSFGVDQTARGTVVLSRRGNTISVRANQRTGAQLPDVIMTSLQRNRDYQLPKGCECTLRFKFE